ncbi:Kelch-like protein 5 [Zootermopsis nevadensis]|uniref:Kelch-like protein 5 n=1 Tax=Zootermopsis nevadensis TaxID=136037 RepID=A0A067QHM7_ZOONE|nr:Kelch-like protein 5 [Zootermopsis nevadensis]
MHSRRWFLSCVAFHGCLYVLGGHNKTSGRLSIEKYDPAEDTWTEIAAMNYYSDELHLEVMDDTIFVIGENRNGEDFLSHVSCFSDKENQWFVSLFVCFFV